MNYVEFCRARVLPGLRQCMAYMLLGQHKSSLRIDHHTFPCFYLGIEYLVPSIWDLVKLGELTTHGESRETYFIR